MRHWNSGAEVYSWVNHSYLKTVYVTSKKFVKDSDNLYCSVDFGRLSTYHCQGGKTGLSHISVSATVNCCFVHFGKSNRNVNAVCVDWIHIYREKLNIYMYVWFVIEIECMYMYMSINIYKHTYIYVPFLWLPLSN